MDRKIANLFKNIRSVSPPSHLEGAILDAVRSEKKKRMRIKLVISRFGLAASVLAGVYTLAVFGKHFLNSEFWNILSLLYSDAAIVAVNWKEFGLSLVETFPFLPFVLILVPIFTLMLSIGAYLDSLKNNQHKYI